MNLYLLEQVVNSEYDTYDSAVVAAPDRETAAKISPDEYRPYHPEHRDFRYENGRPDSYGMWARRPEEVKVTWLGSAIPGQKAGVILASYNAG